MEKIKTDVVVVGTGAAGLYHALHLPKELQICMITKDEVDRSDSFLAQGGMCMLRDEEDYDGYFEDTMRAGLMRTTEICRDHDTFFEADR